MKIAIFSALIALHSVIAGPLQGNPALEPRVDNPLDINQPPTTTRSFSHIVESKAPVSDKPSSASVAGPSSSLRLPVGTKTTSAPSSLVVSSATGAPETRSFRRLPEDTPKPSSKAPVPSAPASSTSAPSTRAPSTPAPSAPAPSAPVPSAPVSSVPVSSNSSAPTRNRTFTRLTPPQPSSSPKGGKPSTPSPPSPPGTITVTVTASARPAAPTTPAGPTTPAIPSTPATPTTSRPASQAPSSTQPPSSTNSNAALAIALNKKFAALTTSSPCDPKNPAQLHACIAGDFHTCGDDGKYAKAVDCVAPLTCFALPLEKSTGASVACISPADAALRMGFNSEEELKVALGKRSLVKRNRESVFRNPPASKACLDGVLN
ncbi:hypothetical protein B9Z19DRAFT_1066697 [Tuber borchii]|uniref:Extracellular membrane protein CFEM domain-containing protein n=1 Tax=Tuber borchii TaxID=42251 RepID=A0A2T6ZLK1_TUBBO|nr:hypothetical protein B9Z19DRAFT_1066697 [Tuber borchii]